MNFSCWRVAIVGLGIPLSVRRRGPACHEHSLTSRERAGADFPFEGPARLCVPPVTSWMDEKRREDKRRSRPGAEGCNSFVDGDVSETAWEVLGRVEE